MSWQDRAPSYLTAATDRHGRPVATSVDRRWLWRLERFLATSATSEQQRTLAGDLAGYLQASCEHHWIDYQPDGDVPAHRQCGWCATITPPVSPVTDADLDAPAPPRPGRLHPPYPVPRCAARGCAGGGRLDTAGGAYLFRDAETGQLVVFCEDCALYVELHRRDRWTLVAL